MENCQDADTRRIIADFKWLMMTSENSKLYLGRGKKTKQILRWKETIHESKNKDNRKMSTGRRAQEISSQYSWNSFTHYR